MNFKPLFFTLIFCFSFLFSIAQKSNLTSNYEIPHYTCDYHRLDVTQWLTGTARKLDANGIVMNNNQYHPLGIVHFGMLSYNYFVDTKDSVYYHHFINQIKYFKDTSKVDYFDNGNIQYYEEYDKKMLFHVAKRSYYKNGQAESLMELIDKKKLTYSQNEFYETGTKRVVGSLRYDMDIFDYYKTGKWIYFGNTGTPSKEELYNDGKITKTTNL